MDCACCKQYVQILREEIVPAMGCTEPIAVAYAAAKAREVLGCMPEKTLVEVSGNIIKNVKSVIVPHTGGLYGIEAATAAGIVAGQADKELEVISDVTDAQVQEIGAYLKTANIQVAHADTGKIFDIIITMEAQGHRSQVRIVDRHTNVVTVMKDETYLVNEPVDNAAPTAAKTDRSILSLEKIVEFANTCDLAEIKDLLDKQINSNMAIAEEGLRGNYGANIGQMMLLRGQDVQTKVRAWAAAGSDARMNGCEMPVYINSGSGNQGITVTVPVVVYGRETGKSEEQIYRALLISNLVAIHIKTGIGTLSAYCGAVSAGVAAGCAIAYLDGASCEAISQTLINAIAIDSGLICDGAKASCAAKIASSVDSGLLGYEMYKQGNNFRGGDGILHDDVEGTIRNVGSLARNGMVGTDQEIIRIMVEGQ
jgi:L-cysteine desulfidase